MASDTAPADVGSGQLVSQDVELDGRNYTVRHFRTGDRSGICSLYHDLGGADPDEWFSWHFEDNPITDAVPMTVGTCEGTVVAAKPGTAHRLTCDGREYVALCAGETLVHPAHRGRGLDAEVTEALTVAYEHADVDFFFGFAPETSLDRPPALDWQSVERVPTYCRIRDPAAMATSASAPKRLGMRLAGGLGRAALRILDGTRTDTGVHVDVHDDLPMDTLLDLYREAEPDGLHALRDRTYLRWRYRHPDWQYRTYVARRGGEPTGAIVLGRSRTDGPAVARLTDVFPLRAGYRGGATTRALLAEVVSDNPDADCLRFAGRSISAKSVRRFGFVSESTPLLGRFHGRKELLVRPCDDRAEDQWSIHGRPLTDPGSWSFGFAEGYAL